MSALEGPLPVRTAEDPAGHRRTLVLGALAGIGATAVAGGGRSATAAARRQKTTAYAAAAWRPLTGHVLPTPHGRVRLASVTELDDEVFEAFRLVFVTMALPDLRGRGPLHQGAGPGLTGRAGGSRAVPSRSA